MKTKHTIFNRSHFNVLLGLLLFLICLPRAYSQNIGINATGATPDPTSMLDIVSSDKGILIPRLALSATNNSSPVTTPTTSLLVYNTATAGSGATKVRPGYYYWDGAAWQRLSDGNGDAWTTFGNTGTDATLNFIGTTDLIDWVIKTNSTERMKFNSGGGTTGNTVDLTSAATTNYGLNITANSLTSGRGINLSANLLENGSGAYISSSSTAGTASGSSYLLYLDRSGANSNSGHNAYGVYSWIANTGTNSSNIGGLFGTTGARSNYGVWGSATSSTGNNRGGYFTANQNSSVDPNGSNYGVYSEVNTTGYKNYGIKSVVANAYNQQSAGWFESTITGTTGGNTYGIYSKISGTPGNATFYNYAGYFVAYPSVSVPGSNTVGVYGESNGNSGTNIGGYFTAYGGTSNYAIIVPPWNTTDMTGGLVGIGTLSPRALLQVNGTTRFGGDSTGTVDFFYSGSSEVTRI